MRREALKRLLDAFEAIEAIERFIENCSLDHYLDNELLQSAVERKFEIIGEALTLIEKAAVLGFSLIKNHPFVAGNKRVGHAALEVMLMLNGYGLTASKESTETVVLAVASGTLDRQAWTEWVKEQIKPLG